MSKVQRLCPPTCQVPFPKPSVSHTHESSPVVHLWERGCPIWLCEPSARLTQPVCTVVQMGTPVYPHIILQAHGLAFALVSMLFSSVLFPQASLSSLHHMPALCPSPHWGKQPEEKTVSQTLGTSSVRGEVIHISSRDGYRVGRREMD